MGFPVETTEGEIIEVEKLESDGDVLVAEDGSTYVRSSDALVVELKEAGEAVGTVADEVSEALDEIGDAVEAAADEIGDVVEIVGDLAEEAVEAVGDLLPGGEEDDDAEDEAPSAEEA